MSAVPPPLPPSATRRFFALILSIITLLCALLYWLALAFMVAQIHSGVYGGPELRIAVTFLTLPPAFLCTLSALALVGWRHCRLAWISLFSFAWPFILMFLSIIWETAGRLLQ